jgi:hypothetical protein
MKKNFTKLFICICAGVFVVTSCEPEMPTRTNYAAYEFAGIDEDGGSWTPILLAASDEIAIDAPSDVASSEYQAELSSMKSEMASLSGDQRAAIDYWTNNPVLRWKEISMELVAKYNLIPGPNEDNTYTLPNPATPDGPSPFPFAHPAYAVRAYAYMSVAQFDGLIAAWHYKYNFNRPAPAQVDNSITTAYGETDLPSYPSDGAVIAATSRDILIAMFPLERAYIETKAAEHMESLIWSGSNVQSDIDAGEFIGAEIAKLALTRAKADGMSKAQCPKPVSDSIANAAFERFGWKWENKEIPVRPVGLAPLYGKVQMWNVPNVEDVRPVPPPAIGSAEFEADVKKLKDFADNMTDEHRRIANYWQDGLGTYTPPGHWDKFAIDFIIKYKLNPLRSARTFAYLDMAMMDAGIACWDAKYYYHYPRPIQVIPEFKTIAGTPNFPSYTSGHSMFSAAAAEVLAYVFPNEATMVRDWAKEAAISRVYGGIHWTFDAEVGTTAGIEVAEYTLGKAQNDGAD